MSQQLTDSNNRLKSVFNKQLTDSRKQLERVLSQQLNDSRIQGFVGSESSEKRVWSQQLADSRLALTDSEASLAMSCSVKAHFKQIFESVNYRPKTLNDSWISELLTQDSSYTNSLMTRCKQLKPVSCWLNSNLHRSLNQPIVDSRLAQNKSPNQWIADSRAAFWFLQPLFPISLNCVYIKI